MKCRKVGMLSAKADPEKQAQFKQEKLEPAFHQAQTGQRKLFFVDVALCWPLSWDFYGFLPECSSKPSESAAFQRAGGLN